MSKTPVNFRDVFAAFAEGEPLAVLVLLADRPMTRGEIMRSFNWNHNYCWHMMSRLRKLGLVERCNHNPGMPRKRGRVSGMWRLAAASCRAEGDMLHLNINGYPCRCLGRNLGYR